MVENWKKHLGAYGIYFKSNKLLVVKKIRGPYINRFDLPGGKLEENESIPQCLLRELKEEIGSEFSILSEVGTFEYLIPHEINKFTNLHHITNYFIVQPNKPLKKISIVADDTSGFDLIDISILNKNNSSPLVMDAIKIIKNELVSTKLKEFNNWKILNK